MYYTCILLPVLPCHLHSGLYMQAQEGGILDCMSRFLFLFPDASLTPASFLLFFSFFFLLFSPCKNGKLTGFCLHHCLLGRRCLLHDSWKQVTLKKCASCTCHAITWVTDACTFHLCVRETRGKEPSLKCYFVLKTHKVWSVLKVYFILWDLE